MKKLLCTVLTFIFAGMLCINVSAVELPDADTNLYLYEDYRCLTSKNSRQYIWQKHCKTNQYGIRTYDGYLMAAIGSVHGDIGDTFHVVLANGTEFDILVGDSKGDRIGTHTVNYDGEECVNVIEFIVDEDLMPNRIKRLGTFSGLDIFGGLYGNDGNIVSMEYTGSLELPE